MDAEIIRRGVDHIQQLRRRNAILEAKVDTFEACMSLLQASQPNRNHSAEVDVAWELNNVASRLQSESEAKTQPTPPEKAGIRP